MENFSDETVFLTRKVFLRLLGCIYLIAFLSLVAQIKGLVGVQGILPANYLFKAASEQFGFAGYFHFPSLFWLNSSDAALAAVCWGGAFISLFVLVDLFTTPALALLWVFYLSLVTVGRDFLWFQWDTLLLETGFLAIFFSLGKTPSKIILWLLRWLVFRLMFSSGVMKLISQDHTWRDLTALTYHYETQPLPTWIGWYAYQLPLWFQKASVLFMFFVELVVPFFIFVSKYFRRIACLLFISLQIVIFLTGNYGFFNLLASALSLLLLDDSAWPKRWPRLASNDQPPLYYQYFVWCLAGFILFTSFIETTSHFRRNISWPRPITTVRHILEPFHIVNNYGLFAVMTTSRPEIIIEGSNDGEDWLEYELPWKPGSLQEPPQFVEPHMPRLDWQMWFAALSRYQEEPWFVNMIVRLLQGSPDVLKLFSKNPFPDGPPHYIRGSLYNYHFTNFTVKKETGNWWWRELNSLYIPEVSLH